MFLAFLLLMAVALLWPAPAQAAKSCTILSTTPIAFGLYDPLGSNQTTPLDSTGSISFECKGGTKTVAVQIDQGQSPAAGSSCATPARRMSSGTARLSYAIYANAARTQVWGCQASNDVDRAPGNNTTNTLNIHGRIPAAQDPSPGAYSDTLTITLIF